MNAVNLSQKELNKYTKGGLFMRKMLLTTILLSAFIMIGVPWLTVLFAGTAGMAICFILFYSINPLVAVFTGLFAGKFIRRLWFVPFIPAILFLLGAWIFFTVSEIAFILYAIVYLLLGLAAMAVTALIKKFIR